MAKDKAMQEVERTILLRGIADIMFDRYPGDNGTNLDVADKMYFAPDGKALVFPAANISSFLTAENTPSAPKRFHGSREYKKIAQAILSYTSISPFLIPFTRNGEPIIFAAFDGDEDKAAGVYIHRSVARLAKGVPNPKVRPVIRLPWELEFALTMYPNEENLTEIMIRNLFVRGGIAIGFGTYRGVFGKFVVDKWE